MMNILLINGPNLNLLGTREPEIYGKKTLSDIEQDLMQAAKNKGTKLECFQSNHEGEIVYKIHESVKSIQGNLMTNLAIELIVLTVVLINFGAILTANIYS